MSYDLPKSKWFTCLLKKRYTYRYVVYLLRMSFYEILWKKSYYQKSLSSQFSIFPSFFLFLAVTKMVLFISVSMSNKKLTNRITSDRRVQCVWMYMTFRLLCFFSLALRFAFLLRYTYYYISFSVVVAVFFSSSVGFDAKLLFSIYKEKRTFVLSFFPFVLFFFKWIKTGPACANILLHKVSHIIAWHSCLFCVSFVFDAFVGVCFSASFCAGSCFLFVGFFCNMRPFLCHVAQKSNVEIKQIWRVYQYLCTEHSEIKRMHSWFMFVCISMH